MAVVPHRNRLTLRHGGLLNSLTRLRSTTVLTVVASVVLAIGAAITLANYVVWATQSKRFNSTYESGQLSAELFRFEATLANRFLPGSQTTQDEIELRYQIPVSYTHLTLPTILLV